MAEPPNMQPNNDFKGSDDRLREGLTAVVALFQILGAWLKSFFLSVASHVRSSNLPRRVADSVRVNLDRFRASEAPRRAAEALKARIDRVRSAEVPSRLAGGLKSDFES